MAQIIENLLYNNHMNLRTHPRRPEGARRRDERNVGFAFSCMSVSVTTCKVKWQSVTSRRDTLCRQRRLRPRATIDCVAMLHCGGLRDLELVRETIKGKGHRRRHCHSAPTEEWAVHPVRYPPSLSCSTPESRLWAQSVRVRVR